ncbi:MAG: cellulase family glycosylhydrolase [Cyanobacteria bacterium REEB67]|nr:cellulase family glycosylhydrolase [Cyanobacteria bacterium REEB67]
MSNLESNQNPTDKIQQQLGSDQSSGPIVNMANPSEVQGVFNNSQDGKSQAVSADGQMIFSNPYGSHDRNQHQDHGHDGRGRHHGADKYSGQTAPAQPGSDTGEATEAGADKGAAARVGTDRTTNQAGGDHSRQQLQTQIAYLQTEINKVKEEVAQLLGVNTANPASGNAAGDNTAVQQTPGTTNNSDTGRSQPTDSPTDGSLSASNEAPPPPGGGPATAPPESTTPPATTADTTGFSVQGSQLMMNGKPFVAVGINDTTSTEHNELTGSMGTIAAEGANTIRIMGQASDLTGGPNNAFNQEIQAALNAGLKVDLSLNSDTAIYGQTGGILPSSEMPQATNALYTAAQEWGNNPNVMFNVMNEQGASGDATNPTLLANTVALEQAVVQGAQSVNPNAKPVIAVDDSEWGQGAYDGNYQSQSFLYNNVAALEAAGNGNVIGAVHNYDTGSSYTNQGIEAIQAAGMPVIAEEVGYNQNSFNIGAQTSSVTGEPIGGLVWVDGTDPQTGSFYNNVLADPNTAPAVQQFWNSVNSAANSGG